MLDPAGWLSQAQALPEGKSASGEHNCGGGRKLVVDNKDDCWTAWCYRCGEHGFVSKPQLSLAERMARKAAQIAQDAVLRSGVRLPQPMSKRPQDWPLAARVWLYKAGLSNDRIEELGIYYHTPTKRVVLPVLGPGGQPVFWQARGFEKDAPKYLSPDLPQGASKPVAKFGSGPTLVLTEDLLSAMRVGEVTEAWCILGTSLSEQAQAEVAQADKPVRIWLDGDEPGRRGSVKAAKILKGFGLDVRAVVTDLDPKLYSKKEITDRLRVSASPNAPYSGEIWEANQEYPAGGAQ